MLDDKVKGYANKAIGIGIKIGELFYLIFIPSSYIYYFSKQGLLGGEDQLKNQTVALSAEISRVGSYIFLYYSS